jgi:hypothetical protein
MKEQKLSIVKSVILEEGDPWYGDRIIFQVPYFQFSNKVERSSYWSIDSDNETLPGSPKWDDVYYSGENQPDFYTCVWKRDFYMKEIRNTCETISSDGITQMEKLVMDKRDDHESNKRQECERCVARKWRCRKCTHFCY